MKRQPTIDVNVGGLQIGSGHPLRVQSMCNTPTQDVERSLAQCLALHQAGAELIRLTTQGPAQVAALAQIKEGLRACGVRVPLVADVHFSAETACLAAAVAHKVRINPGNFARTPQAVARELDRLLEVCRREGTALRIGVNHGSLHPSILERFGNGPQGMVEEALDYLRLCKGRNFHNLVVSLKASNPRVMVEAYRLLARAMEAEGMAYPLHLGVTEAGGGRSARLKSAAALARLLQDGLGDTFRVSLTEDPVNEITFGQRFLAYAMDPAPRAPEVYEVASEEELIIQTAWHLGAELLDRPQTSLNLRARIGGVDPGADYLRDFALDLLQATRCLFSKNEYIACPGCGRTLYNLEETLEHIQKATAHLKGYTLAVMGCIVNGPGEMADADFGYVGEGPGKVSLYKGKTRVLRGVAQEEAVDRLLELMEAEKREA